MTPLKLLTKIILVLFVLKPLYSQEINLSSTDPLIGIGKDYARNYFSPLTNGIGNIMSTGFLGGFGQSEYQKELVAPRVYVGVKAAGMLMQKKDAMFDINFKTNMNYRGFTVPVNWSVRNAPTVFGTTNPAIARGTFTFRGQTRDTTLKLIGGQVNTPVVPLYIPTIGIGTILGTDFTLTGLPGVDLGEYGLLIMYGGAIRHSFGAYIDLPFEIAIQAGVQKLFVMQDSKTKFLNANSAFFNIQFSKTVSVMTFYGGIQYEQYKMDVNYKYMGVDLPFSQSNEKPYRGILGTTLNLGPVKFNMDVNYTDRLTFSGGFGIGM